MRRPIWQGPPRKFPWPSLSAFSRLFVFFLLFWRFGGDLTEHKDERQQAPGGAALATSRQSSSPTSTGTPTSIQCQPRAVAPHRRRRLERSYNDHCVSGQPARHHVPRLRARCAPGRRRLREKVDFGLKFEPVPLPVTQGIARTFQKRPDTKREFCWKLRKLLGRYGILS